MSFRRSFAVCAALVVSVFIPSPQSAFADSSPHEFADWPPVRVGSDIDVQEREYFGLFHAIPDSNFVSAQVEPASDGSWTIRMRLRSAGAVSDSILVLDDDRAQELSKYLAEYERIFPDKLQLDWELLEGIARPVPRYVNTNSVEITDVHGDLHQGELLYVDDRMVVLWTAGDRYDWRQFDASTKVLYYPEIEQIGRRGKQTAHLIGYSIGALAHSASVFASQDGVSVGRGAVDSLSPVTLLQFFGIGALAVGGQEFLRRYHGYAYTVNGAADKYVATIEVLRSKAAFRHVQPPELVELLEDNYRVFSARGYEPAAITNGAPPVIPLRRFHLTFGSKYRYSEITQWTSAIATNMRFAPNLRYETENQSHGMVLRPINLNVNLSYSLSRRWRLGSDFTYTPKSDEEFGMDSFFGTSVAAFVEFLPVFRGWPRPTWRHDIALGAGIAYNAVHLRSTIRPPSLPGPLQPLQGDPILAYEATEQFASAYAHVSYDYYVVQNASAYVRLSANLGPAIVIPERSYVHSWSGEEHLLSTAPEHSVNLSAIGMSLGVRWHL